MLDRPRLAASRLENSSEREPAARSVEIDADIYRSSGLYSLANHRGFDETHRLGHRTDADEYEQ
jgi:hypothetical protein